MSSQLTNIIATASTHTVQPVPKNGANQRHLAVPLEMNTPQIVPAAHAISYVPLIRAHMDSHRTVDRAPQSIARHFTLAVRPPDTQEMRFIFFHYSLFLNLCTISSSKVWRVLI